MSLLDEAISLLMDADHLDQALAVMRLVTTVESVFSTAEGVEDNTPKELLEAIKVVEQELYRKKAEVARDTELPPAADYPVPLPKVIKGPPTGVRGRSGKRKWPKLTIVKGGKSDG